MADKLEELIGKIRLHMASVNPGTERLVVWLGDYVDRGPDSKRVIEIMMSRPLTDELTEEVFLMGNHEQFAIEGQRNPHMFDQWVRNGGDATLASYGISPVMARVNSDYDASLPGNVVSWMKGLELFKFEGEYMFAHAGINPDKLLEENTDADLLWIREPFLSRDHGHPFRVVHGHTPMREADIESWRIGLDTGACFTGGKLTCGTWDSSDIAAVPFLIEA